MVIPEGVEGIDVATAFVGCVSLEKFVINNSDYKTVDGVVYSADGSEVVLFPAGLNKTEYFAPKGVVTIGTNAFYGAIYLTKVVANEVTEIGESAFRLSNILSFTGSNVKYIYHYAFADTSNLKNYDFTGVEEIGDFAFASSGLEKVVLTNSTSYLGVQVFNNCEKLTSLSVSKKTTKFDYADVFYGSNNVKEISIEKANRSFKLVDGILYNYDMTVLYAVINNNSKVKNLRATSGTVTLTAQWEINTYTLTIYYYGGTGRQTNTTNLSVTASTCSPSTSTTITSGSSATFTHTYTTTAQTIVFKLPSAGSYSYYLRTGSAPTTTSYSNLYTSSSNGYSITWMPTANKTISVYVYQRYTISYKENSNIYKDVDGVY